MHIKRKQLKYILRHAGSLLRDQFGKSRHVSGKAHRDILLRADMDSHRYILRSLSRLYPDIPVLSEESDDDNNTEGESVRFIVDPLDGTINYSRGITEYGISLALEKDGTKVYGLVYTPHTDEFYEGIRGSGSTYGSTPLAVSVVKRLDEAVVAVDMSRSHQDMPRYVPTIHPLVRGFRSYGCAVQVLGYIATGKVDAYLYDTPKLWDIAAMQCIIEEAGGLVLDQRGDPWDGVAPLLVCVPGIRDELIACLDRT